VTIVFYISGHGLGHASRDIEVINSVTRRCPGARIVARTTAPHNNAAASHTKRPSKVLTARKTPSNVPARKVRSTPYRTASLSTKHRASVN